MPDQVAPQPSKSRWRGIPGYNYLAHLTKAVVEARVPVIAVILLGVIMLIPSQSAEALRIFAENTVSEKTRFFLFWGGFGLWLIVTTFCALYVAFSRYTKAQKQTLFCNAHRVVYGFALVGPILINGFALQHSGAFPGIGRLMIWASVAIMIGIAAFGWLKHVSADRQVPPERSVATGLWVIIFVLSVIAATIGLLSILLAAAFIFVWSIIGWWWFKQSHVPMNSQDTPRQPKGFWITIIVLLVIFTVSALVAIIYPPPAPIYITLSATFVLSLLTAIYLAGRLIGVAAIAVCFVWLIAMDFWDWNDNHQVRTIPVARNDQKPQEVSAALDEWLRLRCVRSDHKQQLPETCGPNSAEANRKDGYTIVIVAAEGGGMRAAYFTDLVLQELRSRSHARSGDFDKHLFLIVGVSGGSVGAASYAAALYKGKPPSDEAATSGDVTALEADFLSPIISALVPGDFFARFWPFTDLSRLDRARSLEDAFSNALAKPLGVSLHDIKFQEVYRPDPTHPVPALMLMTTDVATGHRMAVSHLTMPDPPAMNYVNGCRRRGDVADTGHVKNLTPRLWTFSEEVENEDLPLDTAAILSARFPLVSPAGTLPSCSAPARRYVDGGYFENSGVTTVLDVIAAVRDNVAAANAKLLVLRIENSHALDTEDGSIVPEGAFSEVLSPVRAMLHTRQARAELAVEALSRLEAAEKTRCDRAKMIEEFIKANPDQGDKVERLRDTCLQLETAVIALRPPKPDEPSEPVPSCEESGPSKPVSIPLGWWLTDKARCDMRRQLVDTDNRPILEKIADTTRD